MHLSYSNKCFFLFICNQFSEWQRKRFILDKETKGKKIWMLRICNKVNQIEGKFKIPIWIQMNILKGPHFYHSLKLKGGWVH